MIECFSFTKKSDVVAASAADLFIALNFEQRQKSRAQALADSGEKIGWFLERGHVLSDGDILIGRTGETVRVSAALESLSEVRCEDHLLLTRIAYHLGNRHVPLQIEKNVLRFQHDHVLDDMVRGLGSEVVCVEKPFSPESGAYHGHGEKNQATNSHSSHSHHHGEHEHVHR